MSLKPTAAAFRFFCYNAWHYESVNGCNYQSNNNINQLIVPQLSFRLAGKKVPIQYQIDEHVIAFWVEGNKTM